MIKSFILLMILAPIACYGQFTISGRVLNDADKKPLANASVFLNNATIGNKTNNDGTFTLHNVKPGKYDLVVSNVAFENYSEVVIVRDSNIVLPDIPLFAKSIGLTGVTIKYHADLNREKYYSWFKDEFLGTSEFASDCKILNPGVLDLSYDENTKILTASSYDFLQIENDALGYKVKYMVTGFSLDNKDENQKKIFYKGPVLFDELKGSPAQERRWKRNRQAAYENSAMHFLRSVLSSHMSKEGFRVQKLITSDNPERPSDTLINERLRFYKGLKKLAYSQGDSLSYWVEKSKLPKKFQKLTTLNEHDVVRPTDQPGRYALNTDTTRLLVAYNKSRRYHIKDWSYLDNPGNTENTLIRFNSKGAIIYANGALLNPYSLVYYGLWGRKRIAELLPVDYEDQQTTVTPSDSLQNVTTKLDTFITSHPTEKVYLHFDKPYYATGDTIYFKAYVTLGERHQFSGLSGILHVDLINTDSKIDQSIKLQLTNGLAWGDFALPDSLPKGNYRVRAYTQWMRNEGNYFDQSIPVGTLHNRKIPESAATRPKAVNANPDLQLFPEGGNLVVGIRSKIAFKAIGGNGLGIEAKGSVVDNAGSVVCQFASVHLGMGYFYLEPEEGKTYKANITFADGTQNKIALPLPDAKGVVLLVNNDSIPSASVKIQANAASYRENRNKDYTMLIYSGGIATTVTCKLDSSVIYLDIIKRRLHTGVARVTLFSPTGELLSERLIFIQNYDQLNLNLSSDKKTYASKGKVSFKLNAKTRADSSASGHFSVSVIDESKVVVDENTETTILNNLLLTSDLKGTVEQPNYYFTNINDEVRKNLDLVMLTHGYRRFDWKQILSYNNPLLAYQPERSLEISGVAKNLLGTPIENGTVSLISPTGGPVLSQNTDKKGHFRFTNLIFMDSTRFVLQAVNANGKNRTQLIYSNDKPPAVEALSKRVNDVNAQMSSYLENNEKQQEELNKLGLGKGRILKEVNIKSVKINHYKSSSILGPGHADQVVHREELEKIGGLLSTKLAGKFHGQVGWNLTAGKLPGLVVVDGMQMGENFKLDDINGGDVETVELLVYGSASIYGVAGGGGVLVITTREGSGKTLKDIPSYGILPITTLGYYKAREFYSPKYESNITNNRPDLRSTIYWNPEVVTDKYGNASFDYYNSDSTGTYRVVVEGIDEKGILGRMVYRYKTE